MSENSDLTKRVEKLENDLLTLVTDYKYMCALLGNVSGFLHNLHSIVCMSDSVVKKIMNTWTVEVDSKNTVSDFLKKLKEQSGGFDGPTSH